MTIPENLQDTMTGTDRGLSLGASAALAIAALVIVVAIVFLGAGALSGNGGPTDGGPTDVDNQTTTAPPTSTEKPTTRATTTTKGPSDLEEFEARFERQLHVQNGDLDLIDLVVRNKTVYVTSHGPAQGGPAVASAEEIGEAFMRTMRPVWNGEAADIGIDHAVVKLYNETDYHWFTMRVEESWAYQYHDGHINTNEYSSRIANSQHEIGFTEEIVDMETFRKNVSSIDGVEVRSLEQYGGGYFAALEMNDFAGDDYNKTIFEISEAFYYDKNIEAAIPTLYYVIYAENGTAVITDKISSGSAGLWHEGELLKKEYRYLLLQKNYDATQIPGGIGSMLTRIQPFPADGPGE